MHGNVPRCVMSLSLSFCLFQGLRTIFLEHPLLLDTWGLSRLGRYWKLCFGVKGSGREGRERNTFNGILRLKRLAPVKEKGTFGTLRLNSSSGSSYLNNTNRPRGAHSGHTFPCSDCSKVERQLTWLCAPLGAHAYLGMQRGPSH